MFLVNPLQVNVQKVIGTDLSTVLYCVAASTGSAALFGDIMQPSGGVGATNGSKEGGAKVMTGDLDSSLANLASNLNFGPSGNK